MARPAAWAWPPSISASAGRDRHRDRFERRKARVPQGLRRRSRAAVVGISRGGEGSHRRRGADVIYDPVGGDVFDESVRCIAFDGRILIVGFTSGRIPSISVNMPLIKGFSVVGVRAGEYGRKFPREGPREHSRPSTICWPREKSARTSMRASACRASRRCACSGPSVSARW